MKKICTILISFWFCCTSDFASVTINNLTSNDYLTFNKNYSDALTSVTVNTIPSGGLKWTVTSATIFAVRSLQNIKSTGGKISLEIASEILPSNWANLFSGSTAFSNIKITGDAAPTSIVNAFSGCSNLETLTFTGSLRLPTRTLTRNAFSGCTSLTTITIPTLEACNSLGSRHVVDFDYMGLNPTKVTLNVTNFMAKSLANEGAGWKEFPDNEEQEWTLETSEAGGWLDNFTAAPGDSTTGLKKFDIDEFSEDYKNRDLANMFGKFLAPGNANGATYFKFLIKDLKVKNLKNAMYYLSLCDKTTTNDTQDTAVRSRLENLEVLGDYNENYPSARTATGTTSGTTGPFSMGIHKLTLKSFKVRGTLMLGKNINDFTFNAYKPTSTNDDIADTGKRPFSEFSVSKFQLAKVIKQNTETNCITKLNQLFNNCKSLTRIELRGLDTSDVGTCAAAFSSCENLRRLITDEGFSLVKVSSLSNVNAAVFAGCNKLKINIGPRFKISDNSLGTTDLTWSLVNLDPGKTYVINTRGYDVENDNLREQMQSLKKSGTDERLIPDAYCTDFTKLFDAAVNEILYVGVASDASETSQTLEGDHNSWPNALFIKPDEGSATIRAYQVNKSTDKITGFVPVPEIFAGTITMSGNNQNFTQSYAQIGYDDSETAIVIFTNSEALFGTETRVKNGSIMTLQSDRVVELDENGNEIVSTDENTRKNFTLKNKVSVQAGGKITIKGPTVINAILNLGVASFE